MTSTRNPLIPTNKTEYINGKRLKTDDSIGSQKSTKSNYSLGSIRSLRSPQRTGGVVYIQGIDPDISLKNILAQVRGGALERVTRANDMIILSFVHKTSADLFCRFANQGQFIVEGRVYCPASPETCVRSGGTEYEMAITQEGARRVLRISRPIQNTECRLLYSKINMIKMERAFEAIGPVVGVQPMFCRNEVAFQIAFESIENAFKSKKLFELKSNLFLPYLGWNLSYCADPTEQGCYISP